MKLTNSQLGLAAALFALSLLTAGALRMSHWASFATPLYVASTIGFVAWLGRRGLTMGRFGFGHRLNAYHLVLALIGVVAVQGWAQWGEPAAEVLLADERDLGRFAMVEASLTGLVIALAVTWTLAAFGEELAFRVLLQGAIARSLGGGRATAWLALITQASVFGAVHAYQGPVGVVGSGVAGLVYGGLIMAARGSIWPSALAHGANNSIALVALHMAGSAEP